LCRAVRAGIATRNTLMFFPGSFLAVVHSWFRKTKISDQSSSGTKPPAAFHRLLCGLTQCEHTPTTIAQTSRRDSSAFRCASSSVSRKSASRHNAGSSSATNFGSIVSKSIVLFTMAFTNLSYITPDVNRVERTSSRAGLTPAVDQRLFTAHAISRLLSHLNLGPRQLRAKLS
jgi:hypothetical protein